MSDPESPNRCPECGAELEDASRLAMHRASEHQVSEESAAEHGIDETIDEASAESFPASDPPSETSP